MVVSVPIILNVRQSLSNRDKGITMRRTLPPVLRKSARGGPTALHLPGQVGSQDSNLVTVVRIILSIRLARSHRAAAPPPAAVALAYGRGSAGLLTPTCR